MAQKTVKFQEARPGLFFFLGSQLHNFFPTDSNSNFLICKLVHIVAHKGRVVIFYVKNKAECGAHTSDLSTWEGRAGGQASLD